jgi:hypothetical protein
MHWNLPRTGGRHSRACAYPLAWGDQARTIYNEMFSHMDFLRTFCARIRRPGCRVPRASRVIRWATRPTKSILTLTTYCFFQGRGGYLDARVQKKFRDFGLRVAQLLNRMEIKLGEIETAGGYKLQNIRIYSFDGSLIATIDVKLFDEASGRLGPALELTVDPQKRIL